MTEVQSSGFDDREVDTLHTHLQASSTKRRLTDLGKIHEQIEARGELISSPFLREQPLHVALY